MKTETIGGRIKHLRTDMNLTQKKFAKIIGITQAHLSGVETGKDNPSESLVRIICNEFNVMMGWLKSGEGSIYRGTIDVESFIAMLPAEDRPQPIEEDLKAIFNNKNVRVQESFKNFVGLFRELTSITEDTTGFDMLTIDTFYCMLVSIHECLSKCTEITCNTKDDITTKDFLLLLGKISHSTMECKRDLASDLDNFQKSLVDRLRLNIDIE